MKLKSVGKFFILYIILFIVVFASFLKGHSYAYESDPKYFLSSIVPFSAVLAFIIFIPVLVLLKAINSFFSKQLTWGWKLTIGGLLLIVCLCGLYIRVINKNPVSLGSFTFLDHEDLGLVTIEGTWVSDTKINAPLQTTKIDCWRDTKQCIEMTAYVGFAGNSYLSVWPTYWDIESWGPEEIRVKDNETANCTTYRLRIDRKNKTVSNIRTTKQPKPKGCEAIQDEPIVMHLTDGYKTQKLF